MSRYVAGFGYSNIKTTTTRHESAPHQSQIRVGVLRIANDRLHLEGIWDVDQAEIHTGRFTTAAPRHTVEQHTETSGMSVSFSTAAISGAVNKVDSAAGIRDPRLGADISEITAILNPLLTFSLYNPREVIKGC